MLLGSCAGLGEAVLLALERTVMGFGVVSPLPPATVRVVSTSFLESFTDACRAASFRRP